MASFTARPRLATRARVALAMLSIRSFTLTNSGPTHRLPSPSVSGARGVSLVSGQAKGKKWYSELFGLGEPKYKALLSTARLREQGRALFANISETDPEVGRLGGLSAFEVRGHGWGRKLRLKEKMKEKEEYKQQQISQWEEKRKEARVKEVLGMLLTGKKR